MKKSHKCSPYGFYYAMVAVIHVRHGCRDPCPAGQLLKINLRQQKSTSPAWTLGSKSQHRLHGHFFKSPEGCPAHAMLFFCIGKDTLNRLFTLPVYYL